MLASNIAVCGFFFFFLLFSEAVVLTVFGILIYIIHLFELMEYFLDSVAFESWV